MAKKRVVKKKVAKKAKPSSKARSAKRQAKAAPKKKAAPAIAKKVVRKQAPVAVPAKKPAGSIESQIKRIDSDILKLINKRAKMTTAKLQRQPNPQAAVLDHQEDANLWERLLNANPGPLPNHAVKSVFREVLSAARQKVKMNRVAYLGPPFSFTHLAAIERFGKSADLTPVSTIASVFEEANRGNADYGVVPIENSTDGRVVDTLDMFTRLPIRICGEVQIAVHHNLLASVPRSEITEIYSKPQALSQCREWLARNMPQARLIEVTSTSTAAQLARDKPGAAAVASRQAAVQYDLQIVAAGIEDNENNITRFAIIGDDATIPTGSDRTAILLQIPHKPGSLADSLNVFKKNKINLTWIESFPLRGPETGYLFFMDFEGHHKDAKIKRTLVDLQSNAVRLEVLGSYPRSAPID